MDWTTEEKLRHLLRLPWTFDRELTPEGDSVLRVREIPISRRRPNGWPPRGRRPHVTEDLEEARRLSEATTRMADAEAEVTGLLREGG